MLSVRAVARPAAYHLYYDVLPRRSPQWRCACALAQCTHKASRTHIFGVRLANAAHRSDLMRLDLLEEHGGLYLDHDSFVLRRLDGVRCTNARAVLAGLESFGPRSRKLNNGVLLAAPNASFLAAWRRDYADYRPATWDYNSCERSYALAQAQPETVEMQRRLGPLPIAVAQYAGFMARTPVLHVTGLFNAPWRQEGVRATGLLRAVLKAVMRRVNRSSSSELNAQQRACASLIERRVLESGLV